MEYSLLYSYPVWMNGLVFLVLLLAAMEGGYRVGTLQHEKFSDRQIGNGSIVVTSMLALLGLIIAFTYAASGDRYDLRKLSVTQDVNAISTAFLRAELVAEPGSTELRLALYEYAKTRVFNTPNAISTTKSRIRALKKTLQAQAALWPILKKIVDHSNRDALEASLVSSINEVLDIHTSRLRAITDKIPSVVIWMLIFISAACLAMTGFNVGVSGQVSRWRLGVLALVLAYVAMVIIDLDRPIEGFIKISDQDMKYLVLDMKSSLGK